MIEETKGRDRRHYAVAVRLAMDELGLGRRRAPGSRRPRVSQYLAELPDLWDVNISYVDNDSPVVPLWPRGASGKIHRLRQRSLPPEAGGGGGGRFANDTMADDPDRCAGFRIGAARPRSQGQWLPQIDEGAGRDHQMHRLQHVPGCSARRTAALRRIRPWARNTPQLAGSSSVSGISARKIPDADETVLVLGRWPASNAQ